jgi:hypothetical protein
VADIAPSDVFAMALALAQAGEPVRSGFFADAEAVLAALPEGWALHRDDGPPPNDGPSPDAGCYACGRGFDDLGRYVGNEHREREHG